MNAEIHGAAAETASTVKARDRRLPCNFLFVSTIRSDMAIRSTGEMGPDAMNEMNVPVVCFIHKPEKDGEPWRWSAVNFMPRKECCGSSWNIEADTKEELMEWIRAKVVPLYEIATNNLREFGKNYYWEPQTPESV